LAIVEVDGVYTEQQTVESLYVTVAQRYSVLVRTKDDTNTNYAISAALDTKMFDHVPTWSNPNFYGYLVYNDKKPLPSPIPLVNATIFDDFKLVPKDKQHAYLNVDHQIVMTMNFDDDEGVNR